MAAQYDFAVNLYADADGVPGDPIAGDTVQAGETFFVEITAEDLRPGGLGLGSMGLHIYWDPDTLREIDAPFNPRDPASSLMTSAFPLARAGTLDNEAGRIRYLTGGALLSMDAGRAIGADGPERLSLLHFRALQAAEYTPLYLQPAGSVGFIPMRRHAQTDLSFESQLITVVESPESAGGSAVNVTWTPEATGAEAESTLASSPMPGAGILAPDNTPLPTVPEAGDPSPMTLATISWRNPDNSLDVNGSGDITALDVLITVNYINAHPREPSLPDVPAAPPPYYDVNGDWTCTAHDALLVVNFLDLPTGPAGRGEGEAAEPEPADETPPANDHDLAVAALVEPIGRAGADASLFQPAGRPAPTPNARSGWLPGEAGGPSAAAAPTEETNQRNSVHARTAPMLVRARTERDDAAPEGASATRIAAALGAQPEWTAPLLNVEDLLDALTVAGPNRQDGPSCVRSGR